MFNTSRRGFFGLVGATAAAIAAVPAQAAIGINKPIVPAPTSVPGNGVFYLHELQQRAQMMVDADILNRSPREDMLIRTRTMIRIVSDFKRQQIVSTKPKPVTLVIDKRFTRTDSFTHDNWGHPALKSVRMPVSIMYLADRVVVVEKDGKTIWVKDRNARI